jgi:hypothetical protein
MYRLENKITLALSDLQALEGDYRSAIDGYETAADKAQNNNLLAWNIKNYLFQAGICHLATGVCLDFCTHVHDECNANTTTTGHGGHGTRL